MNAVAKKKKMFTFNNIQNISIIKSYYYGERIINMYIYRNYIRITDDLITLIFIFLFSNKRLWGWEEKVTTLRVWFNLIDMWKEIFAITTRDEKYSFLASEPLQKQRIKTWKLIPVVYVNDFCRSEKLYTKISTIFN